MKGWIMKNILNHIIGCVAISMMLAVGSVQAATMNDYCIVPPFIQEIAKPNLLMIIDNSASMYDLAYDDKGYKRCSTTTTTTCAVNADCPSGETCTLLRNPYYCFDETFSTASSYVGYFDPAKNYQFNFSTNRFQEYAGTIPTICAMAAVADQVFCKQLSNTLHLNIDKTDPNRTKYFYASGKYLNWLTASKFDVEKEVLTGGKYVTKVCSNNADKSCFVDTDCGTGNTCGAASAFLQPESRGCVGMGYIKDANASDFVNYATGAANPNTSLELSFLVRGPGNPYNPVAASTGGQTYLDIFSKAGTTYDYGKCQLAIESVATGGNADVKQDVSACLASSSTPGTCQGMPSRNCAVASDCVIAAVASKCTSDTSKTCTADADCVTGAGASLCSTGKVGVTCAGNTDCDVKTCTLNAAKSCSVDANCVNATAVQGTCSKKAQTKCSVDADCISGKTDNGPCVGAIPAFNYGTCGVSTVGTCTAVAGGVSTGPCILGVAGGDYSPCVVTAAEALNATKIDFVQNMQACWSLRHGTPIGGDDILTVIKRCPEMYANIKTCSNNGYQFCAVDADCGAGTCLTGPAAIQPGNPGLLCASTYEGQYFELSGSNWVLKAGYDKDSPAMLATHTQFCNDMNTPVVTDPTNPPTTSTTTENIPAILSGLSLAAQLGAPILSIPVKVETASPPSGLVQEYAEKIRIGLMAFNAYGSASETSTTSPLPVGKLAPTKVCSNDINKTCTQTIDCGPGNTCGNAADTDGAKILNLIGKGRCLTEAGTGSGTACTKKAHCSDVNESCVSDGVGDHVTATGLVGSIDSLKAATWTPFAEAYYNAIGYFAVSGATGSRTDMRLNADDFPSDMNPSEYVCQSNNILLVTDGSSTADQNSAKTVVVDAYKSVSGNITGTCAKYAGSQDIDDLAWLAKQRNINSFSRTTASTAVPVKKNESIASYIVFNGADNGEAGDCNNTTVLTKTANNGGTSLLKTDIPEQYEATLRKAFEAVAGGTASGTAASILSNSEGSGANILQAVFYPSKDFEKQTGQLSPTSATWIGEMQNLWYYVDPYIGNSSVREDSNKDNALHIVNDYVAEFQFKGGETVAILRKDSDGNGAGDANVVDPRVISQGYCINTTNLTISSNSKCVDNSGCVSPETCSIQGIVNSDDVNSLWRAGKQLWNRDLSSSPRKLYTHLYGTSVTAPAFCIGGNLTFTANGMVDLVTLNYLDSSDNTWKSLSANDKCIIVALLQAGSIDEAGAILKFTHGYDSAAAADRINAVTPRNRTVAIARKNADGTKQIVAGNPVLDSKTWKLGDIIASTPRVQSFNKLNNYHQGSPVGYGDMTYADDTTGKGYTNSSAYKGRGMAYAGANDGMLHAFKLGSLAVSGTKVVTVDGVNSTINVTGSTKAALGGTGLGEEQWAFIPKNVLPYLKYLADPSYSHLFLVDGPTKLIDASIGYNDSSPAPYTTAGCVSNGSYWTCKKDATTDSNKSWRTLLIGSMGVGGASHKTGTACSTCVKSPIVDAGFSSYFALDITDPEAPKYLWEFSDEKLDASDRGKLGFATSGVAVTRVSNPISYCVNNTSNVPTATDCSADATVCGAGHTCTQYKDTNGRWFAVVGNGPTGPIDTTYHQFKGRSRNPLGVFVLDLKTGALLKKFEDATKARSFTGQMASAPIDTDRSKVLSPGYYSDDALYFGYTICDDLTACTSTTPVWNGGIMRLLTGESIDPNNWSLSTVVSGIGPVTTAIGKLQDRRNHKLWLYTGSGRYFYKGDVSSSAGKILGIKEPCYSAVNDDIYSTSAISGQATKCTDTIVFADADFADQSNGASLNTVDNKKGWFIPLEAEDTTNHYGAERIITEPVTTPNGAVFFTSFMPSTDICNYGGNSYMWGMRYDTGGAANTSQLQGKALVQVSTGAFEEINLSTALSAKDGRKMATPMVGKPPTDPPPIVSASGNKPLKRILHIQEK